MDTSLTLIAIRSYRASDLEPLMALFSASVSGLASAHYDDRQIRAWESAAGERRDWRSRLSRGMTLVAEADGAIAGFITFSSSGHIDLLFIQPDNARCGVASLLYRRAEELLRDRGIACIDTEASQIARPFFTAMGFEEVATELVEIAGVTLTRCRMRRIIASL